MATYNF